MDRGAWGATVHGVTKSGIQLSDSAQRPWHSRIERVGRAERNGPMTGTSAVSLASVEVQVDMGVHMCRVGGRGQLPMRRMNPTRAAEDRLTFLPLLCASTFVTVGLILELSVKCVLSVPEALCGLKPRGTSACWVTSQTN